MTPPPLLIDVLMLLSVLCWLPLLDPTELLLFILLLAEIPPPFIIDFLIAFYIENPSVALLFKSIYCFILYY